MYVVKVNPDRSSSMQIVNAKLPGISGDGLGKNGSSLSKSAPSSIDCNAGCTSTVTGNTNVNVNNANDVICCPNGLVKNYGAISVAGNFSNNKTFTNNCTLSVGTDFNQNGGGVLTNNCRFTIGRNAAINNPITNNSYIRVNQNTTVKGGGKLNLSSCSMF
ncbi:MAG: hypothetical protein ACOVK9_03185, partial [Bacteroidia bacterium]